MARAIHVFRTPDRFVAGTVGQPGNRTFYLQAVHDSRVVSVILEKQQVAVLADRLGSLITEVARRFGAQISSPPAQSPVPVGTGVVGAMNRPHFTVARLVLMVRSTAPGSEPV